MFGDKIGDNEDLGDSGTTDDDMRTIPDGVSNDRGTGSRKGKPNNKK